MWLRYGECLNAVGELQSAVRAYKKVVELAPMHLGARVSLASIQQQLGKHEEALEALETGKCVELNSFFFIYFTVQLAQYSWVTSRCNCYDIQPTTISKFLHKFNIV